MSFVINPSAGGGGGGAPAQTTETGPGGVAGANSGTAVTLPDPTAASASYGTYWMTLSANCTVTMPTVTPGASFVLRWTQDAIGGRAISFAGTPPVNIDGATLTQRTGPDANNSAVCIAGTDPATDALAWYVYPLTSADAALTPTGEWTPSDHGLITWAYDVALVTNGSALGTAGKMFVTKLHVPVPQVVTNLCLIVTAPSANLVAGQNFANLYQGGVLLGSTADQATGTGDEGWDSSGEKIMPIVGGPVQVEAGDVYVGWYANWATSAPQFGRNSSGLYSNFGLANAASRFGTADTGLTTTPPAALGAVSGNNLALWAGLS